MSPLVNKDAIAAALKLLQEGLQEINEPADSPTLGELWPTFRSCEVQYLRSSARSDFAWSQLRGIVGTDGLELQNRPALTVDTVVAEGLRSHLRSTPTARGKVCTAGTVNRTLVVLRRFLHWCHETRRIPYNPLASLAMEREDNIRRTKIRNEAELEKLLAKCNMLLRAFVLVLFDGGLRKSEALNLRRDQITRKPGGGAIIELHQDETKNGRPRQPHITQRALAALDAIPSGGDYFFAKPSGKRYTARYISMLFAKAVDDSGLKGENGERITPHSLRHSFAYVRRVRDRWPAQLIMDQGGWMTDCVMRRYGITDQEERSRAMEEVEARIQRERSGSA